MYKTMHTNEELDIELQPDMIYTRLTEEVRKHYLSYLEKLLQQNLHACYQEDTTPLPEYIRACAEMLENQAIKKCMVVQLYQRAMVKIIASVRRNIKECRLENSLETLISEQGICSQRLKQCSTKYTQTEGHCRRSTTPSVIEKDSVNYTSYTLQEKIDMFQLRLTEDAIVKNTISSKDLRNDFRCRRSRQQKRRKISDREELLLDQLAVVSRSPTPTTFVEPPKPVTCNVVPNEEDDEDQIGIEMAKLFSEEKTELDEIFGIDPNAESFDPQISLILKEIENATVSHEPLSLEHPVDKEGIDAVEVATIPATSSVQNNKRLATKPKHLHLNNDLRRSLWPCELFMQRRRLLASLNSLIEEDFRWHELMKWKFSTLFGEDSDNEFDACSPSIELDEVLIGSCVQRISPWIVKHLMKPLRDGLIANRYLFKKLAKKLAVYIVTVNQYPEERIIKRAVADFFCIHQSVTSSEDLLDMPAVRSSNQSDYDIMLLYKES